MNQNQFVYEYSKNNREKFNEELFIRDDMDIIENIKKVILSSQRNGFFTIQVKEFELVEDYEEIIKKLSEYNKANMSRNKTRIKENIYEYINLRDSDVRLLIVKYRIGIRDTFEDLNVYICVPRFINKYYMRINGNLYSTMFQLVDGSTYNNLTSNSKYSVITMKTIFMPIRLYKYNVNLYTVKNEEVKCSYYTIKVFNKTIVAMKYILAKYGLMGSINFLGLKDTYISDCDTNTDNYYVFPLFNKMYIHVPKMYMEKDTMTQSFVHCIMSNVTKKVKIYKDTIFVDDYWKCMLGFDFNNYDVNKGESVLSSLENIYDISTRESIRLPDEYKQDIYHVIRWMMREFSYLRLKDNLNIGYKKIRLGEYIASLYAAKIFTGTCRISDLQNRANISSIKKALLTHPTFLLSVMENCKLITYRNMVNDMDSLTALKYTYKGVSGLGENNANSIPNIYRSIHESHLTRIDLDSSSTSDPGVSGTICPYVSLYGNQFSDYVEPNYWEGEYNNMVNVFRENMDMIHPLSYENNIFDTVSYNIDNTGFEYDIDIIK